MLGMWVETFKGCFMEEETLNDDKISSILDVCTLAWEAGSKTM